MNIFYGIVSVIIVIITFFLYSISGGEWFSDNYKTHEVGDRCVERDYSDDVFEEQGGFHDKLICEMYALKERDHASEDYNLEAIRSIFSKLGFKMFIPEDFTPNSEDFDAFIKNKTYVSLVEVLSDSKNIEKILDIMQIQYFTWFVYKDGTIPVLGDEAKNYRDYHENNKRFTVEPTYVMDIFKTLKSNPDKIFAVNIYFMDWKTKEISDTGHIITMIFHNGAIHVNDSNVLLNHNYFGRMEVLAGVPIRYNANNILYNILYGEKGALQSSQSDKYYKSFGNCQSWQFIIMFIYLFNPDKKPEVIVSLLLALGDSAKILLMNYWFYMYNHALSSLGMDTIRYKEIDKLKVLSTGILKDPKTPIAYRFVVKTILADIDKINYTFLDISMGKLDTETKKHLIDFCKKEMPKILKKISSDLRTLTTTQFTDSATGVEITSYQPIAVIPKDYLQKLFEEHNAPPALLNIWVNQKDFCTIL